MKWGKLCGIAGVFGIFQGLMPLLGWTCIHTIVELFSGFEKFIPWIALALLSYIGVKMLLDGIHDCGCEEREKALGIGALLLQGIATSIDALSVGFTIAEYDFLAAAVAALLIAAVTFLVCVGGLLIGKKVGVCLTGRASIFGGIILILIGIEIFITSFF